MKPLPHESFIAGLMRAGTLSSAKADAVCQRKDEDPELLVSEILRDMDQLDWEAFMGLLAAEFRTEAMPAEYLRAMQPDAAVIARIGSAQAQELAIFPLDYDAAKNRILVLTAYPFNLHVLEDLEATLGVDELQVAFCDEETLATLQRLFYIGNENLFEAGDDEQAFDIGAASDEEAFPGIYGDAVADYLYSAEPETSEGEADEGVRGSLSELSLFDMLQALAHGRKTCALFLESGGWYGSIYLEDGTVVHAETPTQKGEEAFYEVLGHQTGHFEIVKRTFSGEKTLNDGVEGLLLEGMRRQDEGNR